jgi:hypothetical protein
MDTPTPVGGTATPTPRVTPACCGDCNADHGVTGTEITKCVNILGGVLPLSACRACDCDADGEVQGNEITEVIINQANGCPGFEVTPTPALPTCICDCNNNGTVSALDVQTCVNIMLGQPVSVCPVCDSNHDGIVDGSDINRCIAAQQQGCVAPTPPRTPTATPSLLPRESPTPGHCLGNNQCSANGALSTNLSLCLPGLDDVGWGGYINLDLGLIDSLFPFCALQPANGGTGTTETPAAGALLVGGDDRLYHVLAPGGPGEVLASDPAAPNAVEWRGPAFRATCNAPPDARDCTDALHGGRLALDTCVTPHRLYVCTGVGGWRYAELTP